METIKSKSVLNAVPKWFWLILGLGFVMRVAGITAIPAGINQDEAMGAMDAWSLALYGTDRYGTQLPVHFTAWKTSQMSVLLAYMMVPFIKIFGFNLLTIRLPMVLMSTVGIGLVYLIARRFFTEKLSLAIMTLTAINPWHFMQSRWALDCNLFPHMFLIGFYFLLLGLEKRKYLYLSMVFFGLTFYCYGIAIYTVPVFLFVYAGWCLWKKQLSWKNILISVAIFFGVALPEIITMAINVLRVPTIETPLFTMPQFPESVRGSDILFMNFSFAQLGKNTLTLIKQVFLQFPDHLFNTLPAFGPLYHISIPFIGIGMVQFTKRLFAEKDLAKKTVDLALWGFLIMGIWAGIITYEVNVNRINIIFYPLLLLCGYGIGEVLLLCGRQREMIKKVIIGCYAVCGVAFLVQYYADFSQDIREYFNVDFLEITEEADKLADYDKLYITSEMGWQINPAMAEILTQYSCRIDAQYYQEKTNETGGRKLLPYSQRYHFVHMDLQEFAGEKNLYILHREESDLLPEEYEVVLENESFVAVKVE